MEKKADLKKNMGTVSLDRDLHHKEHLYLVLPLHKTTRNRLKTVRLQLLGLWFHHDLEARSTSQNCRNRCSSMEGSIMHGLEAVVLVRTKTSSARASAAARWMAINLYDFDVTTY